MATRQHALRDWGLVTSAQQGCYVNYQLSDPRVAELLSFADELLADVAQGIYECAHCNISVVLHSNDRSDKLAFIHTKICSDELRHQLQAV